MLSSFKPIENARCNLLILGTMPGEASLKASQYYAYKQNHFWRIMSEILISSEPSADYEKRKAMLLEHNIALWDVLANCFREGSSDNNIKQPVPNDFAAFFAEHSRIHTVYFNGHGAEGLFKRLVAGKIDISGLEFTVLPSTSPANTMKYEEKLKLWRQALSKEPNKE